MSTTEPLSVDVSLHLISELGRGAMDWVELLLQSNLGFKRTLGLWTEYSTPEITWPNLLLQDGIDGG